MLVEGDFTITQLKNSEVQAYFKNLNHVSIIYGGQSDDTINDLRERLSLLSLQSIDIIVLSVGSNDLSNEEVNYQHVSKKLISLVKYLQTACPWIFVLVLALPPRYASVSNKPVAVFNAQVSAINATLQTVNMSRVMFWCHKRIHYSFNYHDGIHFSATGREYFGKSVFRAIMAVYHKLGLCDSKYSFTNDKLVIYVYSYFVVPLYSFMPIFMF